MILRSLDEPTPAFGRVRACRLGIALLAAATLTVAVPSPGMAAAGTGDLTQLTGSAGTYGCVSQDGTEGGGTTLDVVCETEPLLSSPEVVAASPDGKHVYVAQTLGSKLLIFARTTKSSKTGPSAGALVPAGSTAVTGAHKGLIVSPDGKNVYLTSGSTLSMFSRDKNSGTLSALAPPKIQALQTPEGLAITQDGKQVYVASRGLQGVILFDRNKKTGVLSRKTCLGENGAAQGCTQGIGLKGAADVAISQDGKNVYVTADVSNAVAILTRDKKTGNLTQAPSPDGCWSQTGQDGGVGPNTICLDGRGLNGPNGIAVPANDKFVYVASSSSNAIAIFSRNTTTGALTQLPDTDGCVSQEGNDGNSAAGVGQCTAADIGGLTKVQKVVIGENPENLYTTAKGSGATHNGAVSAFTRDEDTGALTQLSCVGPDADCSDTGVALHHLQGIALTKDGKSVYVAAPADEAIAAFERDR